MTGGDCAATDTQARKNPIARKAGLVVFFMAGSRRGPAERPCGLILLKPIMQQEDPACSALWGINRASLGPAEGPSECLQGTGQLLPTIRSGHPRSKTDRLGNTPAKPDPFRLAQQEAKAAKSVVAGK